MLKFIKFSIILLAVFYFLNNSLFIASAETTIIEKADCTNFKCNAGDTSPEAKICCGNYQLNDFIIIATKVANIILGIVGSLALLAFVAGGLMMMLSAGNAEWVTRGRQTLIGAIIGLTVVFTSYTIIYFVFESLGVPMPSGSNWFTPEWFK